MASYETFNRNNSFVLVKSYNHLRRWKFNSSILLNFPLHRFNIYVSLNIFIIIMINWPIFIKENFMLNFLMSRQRFIFFSYFFTCLFSFHFCFIKNFVILPCSIAWNACKISPKTRTASTLFTFVRIIRWMFFMIMITSFFFWFFVF